MEQWEVYSSQGQKPGQPADAQVCPTLMVPLSGEELLASKTG